jgi:hypothetical protein
MVTADTSVARRNEKHKTPAAGSIVPTEPSRVWSSIPINLGCDGSIFSVLFRMFLCGLGGMVVGVMKMTLGGVSVMRRLLVVSMFVVFGGFPMVASCLLVVIGCVAVMFGGFL